MADGYEKVATFLDGVNTQANPRVLPQASGALALVGDVAGHNEAGGDVCTCTAVHQPIPAVTLSWRVNNGRNLQSSALSSPSGSGLNDQ